MNNLAISKLSFFLAIFLIFTANPIFAQLDSLDCDVESVVFECQGEAANRAAAEAWYQRNFDRLKANCIARDSGSVTISKYGLGSQNFCGGCTVYGNFEIIDTVGGITFERKTATFKIIDTTPPVFLDSTHDTIQCSYRDAIFGWQEGVQNYSRVSDCSVTWSIGFRSNKLIEKTEKTKVYEYVIALRDYYNNIGYQTIYLTVLDTTPPEITCHPDDLQLECNGQANNQAAAIAWNVANLTKLQNCSREYCSDVFVTSDFEVGDANNSCELVVTYSISDKFDNISTRTATLFIIDTTPPVGQCNLGKSIVACTEQYPIKPQLLESHSRNLEFLAQCASDNCGSVEITHDFDTTLFREDCLSGPTDFFINYYLTDNCGNSTNVIQAYDITYRDMEGELCQNLKVETKDNQLIIAGLSAPITIAKIYNQNYELVFECNSNNQCPETVNVSDLEAGETYYIDIQFFEEDWQFICENKQDIIIEEGVEPCDTSICQGDVILRTQAEVDAFCGCEVIEGNLEIESESIFNIKELSRLKEVSGSIIIKNTRLANLIGLDNLKFIAGALAIEDNSQLIDLSGLENLKQIDGVLFIKFSQNKLSSLSNLKNLKHIGGLGLDNLAIKDLFIFKSLDISKLRNLVIINCDNLRSLEGLNTIQSIGELNGNNQLVIVFNKSLTDINAIENINSINGELIISSNPLLEDCCSISHLIDDDSTNGFITGNVSIYDNPQFCNSLEDTRQNCQTQPLTCEDIQIITQNNQITIDGLTVPNEIVKVFDKDYNILFECNGNCDDRQIAGTFPEGNYVVDLQLYDENWGFICAEQRTVILDNNIPCNNIPCESKSSIFIDYPQLPNIYCSTDSMEYCLGIPVDSISNFDIVLNGVPYNGTVNTCSYSISFAYTYFTLPVRDRSNPYVLNNWTINGNSFSTEFETIQQLVDSMNVWDTIGIWTLNEELFIIEGGSPKVEYGSLDITDLNSSEGSTLALNNNASSNGIAIKISLKQNEIEVIHKETGCSEIIFVEAYCISCKDNIPTENTPNQYIEKKLAGSCKDTYTYMRNWTTSTSCQELTQFVQFIRVEDSTAPIISNISDITINEQDVIPSFSVVAT